VLRWVDVTVKVALVSLLAFGAFSGLDRFAGKAFGWRLIGYTVAAGLVPAIWAIRGRRRPYPYMVDTLFVLPFLIDTIGNALDLYDTIDWWDDANHLVNWALHTSAVGLLLRYGEWTQATRVALAFGYAVTTAVLWEFAEFVTFVPNSPEAVTAYADTLFDLFNGMVGGLIGAVVTSRLPLLRRL
jgi:hypothetical protein